MWANQWRAPLLSDFHRIPGNLLLRVSAADSDNNILLMVEDMDGVVIRLCIVGLGANQDAVGQLPIQIQIQVVHQLQLANVGCKMVDLRARDGR